MPGSAIYYTLNGTTPTASSTKYAGAITVSNSETIRAIAVAPGHLASAVALAAYVIETPAPTPTFSVPSGTYPTKPAVSIYDSMPGAAIYYTLNGAMPTVSSTKYAGAILVTKSEMIRAIAVAPGYLASAVATAAYVIETPTTTPTFSVPAGTYTATWGVSIYDSMSGVAIYYTLNGTTPTVSSTKYAGAISVSKSETIKAIAVAPGYLASAAASATYVIETLTPTPTFSVPAGTYTTTKAVSIYDSIPGAAIYYTLNGATPTTSSAKYTGSISVSSTETVKAIALVNGDATNPVASATYVIQ
jgi:hypothetical protein